MSFTTADYIAQFRRDNNRPEFADWNDEKILQTYIDEFHKTGELARHPALLEYMNDSRFDGTSLVDEVKAGWNRGVDQFQGKLYDTARLAGDLVGSERMSEWGREGYERNKTEAGEEASPIVDRWEDVDDFKSFTYWAANQVAQNAPQLIGTLAAAAGVTALAPKAAVLGGGGLIARGVGALTGSALRNEAGAFAGLAVNRLAGALAASGVGFAQMQNYGELLDQGGENAKELAVLNGAVGSILEAVTPVMAINKVFGRAGTAALDDVEKEAVQRASESILKRGAAWVVKPAVEAAKEGSTEMLTEMAQEAVSMATEAASMRNDPNFKLEDDVIKSRLLNAGLAGFLLGAASGTGAGVVGESQLRGSKEYIAARAQAEAEEVGSTPQDNLASMKQPESTAPRASLDVSVPPIQAQPQPATEGVPNGLQEKGQKEVVPAVVPAPVAVPTPTAPEAVTPEKPLPLAQVKNRVKAIERELVAIAQADPSIDLTPIQEQLRNVGTDPMKLSQVEAAVPPLADKASQAWAKRALQNIQDQLGKQIGAVREQRQRAQTVSANREGREVLKQQDMNAKRQRILEEELAAQAMQQPTGQPAAAAPAAQVTPEVPTSAPAPTPVFRKANEIAWKAEQAEVPKGRDPIKILDGLLPPKRAAKSRSQSRRFAVFSLPDGSVEMREMVPGAKVPTLYPSVDRANKAAPEGRVPGHRGVTKLTVESYFKRLPGAQLLAVYDTKDADVASVYKFANAEEYSSVFGYREAATEKAAPAAKGWRGVSEDTLTRVFNLMNDNTLGAEDAIMSSAKLKRYFAEAFPNPSQLQGALDRLNSTFYTSQTAEDFAQKVVQGFVQEKGQKASQTPAAKAAVLEESGQVEQVDLPQEPKRKPAKSKAALTVRSTFNPGDTDSYAVRFSTLASDLAKRGLSVVLADARKMMGTDAAGGRYDPSDRTVLLSVQNVVSPSKQSYIALVHEAVHDQIEQLPETVREALHVWIDKAFAANPGMAEQAGWDPRLAQQGALPEGAQLGSRTNELLVESLAQAGVDRAQATGMLDTLWRTIKHYLTQAAIYLQEKLLGKDYTEGKLAEAFANNLVDRMLAGDDLRGLSGFLSQFGRPNTLGDVLTVSDEHGRLTLDSIFDPVTGEVSIARDPGVSKEALVQNVMRGLESLRANLVSSGSLDRVAQYNALMEMGLVARMPPSADSVPPVRDASGNLLAPNGKPSKLNTTQWKWVRTPEFKAWFGDWENDPANASKVVDENGEPLVVYHGTKADFEAFRTVSPTEPGAHFGNKEQAAFFSRANPDWAVQNGDLPPSSGNAVYPVFLSIKKPLETRDFYGSPEYLPLNLEVFNKLGKSPLVSYHEDADPLEKKSEGRKGIAAFRATLRQHGFDGAGYLNLREGNTEQGENRAWLALSPEQVKSATGNNGNFDSGDPRIAYTVRPLDAAVNKITDAMHSIAANAQIDVAKLNQLDKTYRSLHEWYTRQYPSEKKSYADFVTKVLGVRDPVADRSEALAAANANLQAEFDSKEYSLTDHTFRDGTKFNVDMLLDDMNEIERGRAELETYKSAKKVYDTQVKALTKEKESLADLNNRIEESRTELTDVTTKLNDVMEHDRRVTNLLRQSIANVQKLYEQQKLVAENRGILADAFVRIMGESAERVQVNDRLTHAVESRLAELPMKSILDRLAAIGVTGDASVDEIVTAVANDVAANPGSVLAQVAMRPGETPETTNAILFASIISLIKKNEVEAGLLRLSGTRTGAALAEMEKVREILSAQTEQKLKEIRVALRKGPSYRIASKLIEKRQALLKEIADHAKLTHSTEVREALLPSFKQLVDSLSNRIELVLGEMNVHAGIPVPQSDSTVEQLSDRTKWTKVEFDKGSGRLLTDVPALLKKYNDWIEAHKDKPDVQGGSMFREMRRVAEQLREVMVQTERADLRGGWVSSGYLLGSVSHLMEAVGNQYGALAARLMRLFASGVSQGQLPAYNRGAAVEVAIDRAARALGVTVNEFNEFFLSPGKTFFENESFSDWTQAERALREYMVADKVTPGRQSLKNDRVWKAFMQAFKSENEARMFNATRMGESEQTKVRDPEVNGARKLIHRGLATFPRRIRDRVRTTVRELRGLFSGEGELALVKDPKTPGDVARNAKILSENPKLKDIIAPYFYNNRNMMAPLPENNVFGADRIPTARSSELWLASGGNILGFADRVFDYYFDENAVPNKVEEEGGTAAWIESEKNKYRETLVNWTTRELTRLFNMVRSQDGLDENLNIQTINMSALMMDAREANTLPDAMIEYPMHTREFMQAVNHSLNGVKVFGHDYEKLFPLIKAAASEVESEAKEYALLREDPRAMAEMRQKDPKKLERLKEASRLFQLLGDNGKNVVNDIVLSFNPEDRGLRNASLFWTAFDASLSFIMSGPRSGLKQAASILNLAALGRSPTSGVRLAAKGFHNFTQEMLAGAFNSTLGQVLPMRWNPNSRARRLLASSMYGGPMPSGNIVELVAGHHGPRGENDYGVNGKLRKGVRKWNEAFKNAQLGAGDPNAAPLARINPFNWSQLGTNMALYETVFNEWSDLVEKAAWFKLENPDLANKSVDHAMLGVPKNYFDSAVKGEFAKYGLDIDTSVDFAMKKIRGNEKTEFVPQSDAPFLWKYSIDQLSGEASPLTNRPAFTQKSTLTRKLWTLISYPLFQTQRIMDLYRTADGRKTAKSIAQGLSVTALFMLPASLAFSAMLDLYDEEIMGKKQARRPMRPEDFHNNLLGLLERINNAGTGGLFTDLAQGSLGMFDASAGAYNSMSLDRRIVMANQLRAVAKTLSDGLNMGYENWNYANFYRPAMMAVGLGGPLQMVQTSNNLVRKLGIEDGIEAVPLLGELARWESNVTDRTTTNNYIRGAMLAAGYETRAAGGAIGTPSPITPWVTNMQLAALRNDQEAFRKAYEKAVKAAMEIPGETDPIERVRNNFASRHPLKQLPAQALTPGEWARVFGMLGEQGRSAVMSAVGLMNAYGSAIGVKPYFGSTTSQATMRSGLRSEAIRRTGSSWNSSLEDLL